MPGFGKRAIRTGSIFSKSSCLFRLPLHSAPPPEKYHGLTDAELRYRHRYIDMYVNPETMQVMQKRSQILTRIRRFMDETGSIEVETTSGDGTQFILVFPKANESEVRIS